LLLNLSSIWLENTFKNFGVFQGPTISQLLNMHTRYRRCFYRYSLYLRNTDDLL